MHRSWEHFFFFHLAKCPKIWTLHDVEFEFACVWARKEGICSKHDWDIITITINSVRWLIIRRWCERSRNIIMIIPFFSTVQITGQVSIYRFIFNISPEITGHVGYKDKEKRGTERPGRKVTLNSTRCRSRGRCPALTSPILSPALHITGSG